MVAALVSYALRRRRATGDSDDPLESRRIGSRVARTSRRDPAPADVCTMAAERLLEQNIQRRFIPFALVGLLAPLTALIPPRPRTGLTSGLPWL